MDDQVIRAPFNRNCKFRSELLFCVKDNSICIFSNVILCELEYVRGFESLCVHPSLVREVM